MSHLNGIDVRKLVERASVLQKFRDSSPGSHHDIQTEDLSELFEVTDPLGLDRDLVYEALREYKGLDYSEPIVVDRPDNQAEVMAFAKNGLDESTIREFASFMQYEFDSRGKILRKGNKIVWRIKPTGIAKFFAIQNSVEAEIENHGSQLVLRVRRNLKTLNKLYIPAALAFFGASALFVGALADSNGDTAPMLIISFIMAGGSFMMTRLVKRRKHKMKGKLIELMEATQQIFERRFLGQNKRKNSSVGEIEIPEMDALDSVINAEVRKRQLNSD